MLPMTLILSFAIATMGGSAVEIPGATVSDKLRDSGEVASVSVIVQQHTAQVVNLSERRVISGLCGVLVYSDINGVHETRWMHNFAGPFLDEQRGLAPGGEFTFGPRRFKGFEDRYLPLESFDVTGIVFTTGRTDGNEGAYCKARMLDGARAARMQVMEIRRLVDRRAIGDFVASLRSPEPMVRGQDSLVVHRWLQHLLLDEDQLRPDYLERLDKLIDRLGKF